MDASGSESTQQNPAIQWYPDTPIDKAANSQRPAMATDFAILLIKTDTASFHAFSQTLMTCQK